MEEMQRCMEEVQALLQVVFKVCWHCSRQTQTDFHAGYRTKHFLFPAWAMKIH